MSLASWNKVYIHTLLLTNYPGNASRNICQHTYINIWCFQLVIDTLIWKCLVMLSMTARHFHDKDVTRINVILIQIWISIYKFRRISLAFLLPSSRSVYLQNDRNAFLHNGK